MTHSDNPNGEQMDILHSRTSNAGLTEHNETLLETLGQAIRAQLRPERANDGPLYLDHDVYEYESLAAEAIELIAKNLNNELPVQALVALSRWIDQSNAHRDPEAVDWGRLAKITEEAGEVIEAYIGATGQNPRKGITKTMDDVREELLDVAVTALGAYEHLDNHRGHALDALQSKIIRVATRAGAINTQTNH